jgi:hypothetical protein
MIYVTEGDIVMLNIGMVWWPATISNVDVDVYWCKFPDEDNL